MECDDFARLRLIQQEITKFSNKTKEEKDEFLNNVKEICIYNQSLFLKYGKDSFGDIENNAEMQLILKFLLSFNKTLI
jgi:hypothetical protein